MKTPTARSSCSCPRQRPWMDNACARGSPHGRVRPRAQAVPVCTATLTLAPNLPDSLKFRAPVLSRHRSGGRDRRGGADPHFAGPHPLTPPHFCHPSPPSTALLLPAPDGSCHSCSDLSAMDSDLSSMDIAAPLIIAAGCVARPTASLSSFTHFSHISCSGRCCSGAARCCICMDCLTQHHPPSISLH